MEKATEARALGEDMCALCSKHVIADAQTQEKLRRLAQRVIEAMTPQEVWLFGPFAYGDWHEFSDVDLLMVVPAEGRLIDRDLTLSEVNDTELHVEALIYTPEQYAEMARGQTHSLVALLDECAEYEPKLEKLGDPRRRLA
ncbi:MAG: nucleotidyltransferase domain-containing protein [Armatimonadota bacterium]